MVSCIAFIKWLAIMFSCSMLVIVVSMGSMLNFILSSLLNTSQLVSLKLNDGRDLTHSCGISSLVIIGK